MKYGRSDAISVGNKRSCYKMNINSTTNTYADKPHDAAYSTLMAIYKINNFFFSGRHIRKGEKG